MKEHFDERRDFPSFIPLQVLEISESLPQFIMQSLLFWMGGNNLRGKWNYQQRFYVLSSVASIVAMLKAIYMYYQRYAIVKKGFIADAIDDAAYLFELIESTTNWNVSSCFACSSGNYEEIVKVVNRMKAQNTIRDINYYSKKFENGYFNF